MIGTISAACFNPCGNSSSARILSSRTLAIELFRRHTIDVFVSASVARDTAFKPVRIADLHVWGQVSHFTFRKAYFDGEPYEPLTTRKLLDTLTPGAVFIDIGANRGYFTLLAALRIAPQGRVIAFEPNPAVLVHLRNAIRMNGVDNQVAIHQLALSDHEAPTASFYVPDVVGNDGFSSLLPLGVDRSASAIDVAVTTYDAWATAHDAPRADLMKIDVEGAELGVLSGMAETLREKPPRHIVLETTEGSAACELLRSAGYRREPLEVSDEGFGNWLFTLPS